MIKKLTVDRIESDIAVLFDEDGNKYSAPISFKEGAILECEIAEDGNITVLHSLEAETAERKAKNASRLRALFEKEIRNDI
ncbi:MAG: DUF3006 domain-containing protein [Clostridia bacterium]|nr:DUF3006 domain-containing protein [Clostridia bacterium]